MPQLNLDETFYDSFSASTIKTLNDLCHTSVTMGTPFNKGEHEQVPYAIAGVMGITSSVVTGSITLCFPKPVFIKLMETMMGETLTDIRTEDEDAAAELLNIIFGLAKAVLNRKGYSIHMAIPSVLRGGQVFSSYSKGHLAKVIPFSTPAGDFYVEFLLEPVPEVPVPPQPTPASPGPSAAVTRANFFMPFMDNTVKTLKIQCNLDAKPGKPFSKKASTDYSFDVAGIIGITSKTLNGSFMLSFKMDVFLKLISRMFGETITHFQPGFEDAVSELVNIILGGAKATLNERGHGIAMAIPAVIRGQTVIASYQQRRPGIVIPFQSELGDFFVEVSVE